MATPAEAQPSASSPSRVARERGARFCRRFGLQVPILQAPMAGACPAGLASAVANAGGMGGLGALTTPPDGIASWVREFRDQSNGGFQINLWIPDPPPVRDAEHEREVREFLRAVGPARAGGSRRCRVARLCRTMRSAARCRAARRLIDHGAVSGEIHRRNQGARHRLVRLRDDARRSPRCRGRRCRRHRCARLGGRRPPRLVRCRGGRASIRWAIRSRAAAGGQIVGADHRDRRDRRWRGGSPQP